MAINILLFSILSIFSSNFIDEKETSLPGKMIYIISLLRKMTHINLFISIPRYKRLNLEFSALLIFILLSLVGLGQNAGDKIVIKKGYFVDINHVFEHDSSIYFFGQTNSPNHGPLSGQENTDITILRTNYEGVTLSDITFYNPGSDRILNTKIGNDGYFYIAVSSNPTGLLHDKLVKVIKTDGISLIWETRLETDFKDLFLLNDGIIAVGYCKEYIINNKCLSYKTEHLDFFFLDFEGNIKIQKLITGLTSIIDRIGKLDQMKFFLANTNEKRIGIIASIQLENAQSKSQCYVRKRQSTSSTEYLIDELFYIDSSFNLIQDFNCFEINADLFSVTYNEKTNVISAIGSHHVLDENMIDYRNPHRITFQMFKTDYIIALIDPYGRQISSHVYNHTYDTLCGSITFNDSIKFLIVRDRDDNSKEFYIGLRIKNNSVYEFLRYSISEDNYKLMSIKVIIKNDSLYFFSLQRNKLNYVDNLNDLVLRKVRITPDP